MVHHENNEKLNLHLGDFSKLIANEAVYHKGCHASCINIKDKAPPADPNITFRQFLEQIEANLSHGRAYDMSTLLAKNIKSLEISSDEGMAKAYTSQNLKKRLQNHFGKKIVFFSKVL